MAAEPDPFDEGVPRNGRGNPLIIPAGRGGKPNLSAKLVPYTRASTFAKALSDGSGMSDWKVRHAVIGVAVSPDLASMAAALGRNLNDFDRDRKAALDEIIVAAHDRSGGNDKANYGTAVHSLTEPDPFGLAIDERMAADAHSYTLALAEAGLEAVETEVFVVNDELKAAGTYDHIYRCFRDIVVSDDITLIENTLLLGDKKTGSLHFDEHAIQEAIYARGKAYDHNTGERTALDVSPQWGIVAHIARGEAKTTLYLVDLHAGWEGAKLAGKVREYRQKPSRLSVKVCEIETPHETAAAPVDGVPCHCGDKAIEANADGVADRDGVMHRVVACYVPAEAAPQSMATGGIIAGPPVVAEREGAETVAPKPVADQIAEAAVFADEVAIAKAKANAELIAARHNAATKTATPEPVAAEPDVFAQAEAALAEAVDAIPIDTVIMTAIAQADSGEALRALWTQYRADWADTHTETVKARLAVLTAA